MKNLQGYDTIFLHLKCIIAPVVMVSASTDCSRWERFFYC
nr:MAG TPA: hypothetical protein [Caudoviricetes sp.]